MATVFLPLSGDEHAWCTWDAHKSKPGLVSEKPNVLVGQIYYLSYSNKCEIKKQTLTPTICTPALVPKFSGFWSTELAP